MFEHAFVALGQLYLLAKDVLIRSSNGSDTVSVKLCYRVQQCHKCRRVELCQEAFWRSSTVTKTAQLVEIYQNMLNNKGSENIFY